MPELYYSKAVNEALDEELARDKNVVLIGEDIGIYGGAFGATRGLFEKYGAERLWETPISENSFTGLAVGAAMMGMRPVVEIMFMDFIALALDQLLNSAGKLHYMYGGQVNVPLVLRTPGGAKGGYGPSHSQMLSNLLVGVPGLKVVAPSNAMQVKGILKAAIRDDNPVVVIENKRLYPQKGIVPEGDYTLPLDKAVVFPSKLAPTLTLASYSSMTPVCLAVQQAYEKAGIGIEVVDLVSLQPLDTATVFASLRKTGRIVIAEEACLTGGVGAELSALIAEHCLDALEAPIARVAAKDLPIPSSLAMEKMILPQPDDVVKAVKKTLDY
ncbi:MAG: alpha-ketoacid dehydrogenase subunit beta [Victivallales bacterium]|nr:alpha-ketoacid dehydrogenase subunit beta [Victivallales bacterium]